MHKLFGALRVELTEDTQSGIRVRPVNSTHDGDHPIVTQTTADKYQPWIGITAQPGLAGEIVSVFPPYAGLVMARIQCDETEVHTGYWANTEENGQWSCHSGTGEIATGVIVSPELHETVAPGKVVKAMIFTGRFIFDQKSP